MNKTSRDYQKDYTKPELREKLKEDIKESNKGGKRGQWSARKSQLLVKEYEKHGGGYKHSRQKTPSQKSLDQWTEEDWQTMDGKTAIRDGKTVRYLPRAVWEQLSEADKKLTNEIKVNESKKGYQTIDNPETVKNILAKVHQETAKKIKK